MIKQIFQQLIKWTKPTNPHVGKTFTRFGITYTVLSHTKGMYSIQGTHKGEQKSLTTIDKASLEHRLSQADDMEIKVSLINMFNKEIFKNNYIGEISDTEYCGHVGFSESANMGYPISITPEVVEETKNLRYGYGGFTIKTKTQVSMPVIRRMVPRIKALINLKDALTTQIVNQLLPLLGYTGINYRKLKNDRLLCWTTSGFIILNTSKASETLSWDIGRKLSDNHGTYGPKGGRKTVRFGKADGVYTLSEFTELISNDLDFRVNVSLEEYDAVVLEHKSNQ